MLLSTHILPEVAMVCDKVVIVNRGRVVVEGPLSQISRDKSLEQVFLESVSQDGGIVAAA